MKIFISVFVLLLIFFLVAVSMTGYMPNTDKVRQVVTKKDLCTLHQTVDRFKMDTGRYPTAEKGLLELVEPPADVTGWAPGGYLEQVALPKDGWKNDFMYILSPDSNSPFDIISYGADGKPGGTDSDADLHSTDLLYSE